MKPKLILTAILLAAAISSCKKSETLKSANTASAAQKTVDNTPGCGIDTAGEGVKFITASRGIVSGNIMLDAGGNIYSTMHLFGPDFNYYKNGVVDASGSWAGVFLEKVTPNGKLAFPTALYTYDGNINIPLGPLPSNYGHQSYYTLPVTAADASGNFFELHTLGFDNGYSLNATAYLSKYNSAGTLLWKIQQNEGSNLVPNGIIKTDAAGNVYLFGNYSAVGFKGPGQGGPAYYPSPINFDPSNTTNQSLSGTGSFILKLDANGKFVSVTQVNHTLGSFAIDDNGEIYDTGVIATSNGPGSYTYANYVRKIGGNGNLIWQKGLGNFREAVNLNIDNKGNTILWGPNSFAGSGFSGIGKFDGGGAIKWYYKKVPAIQTVATDALGNIYTIGSFAGTVNFSPNQTPYNLTANGPSAIFIQKFSPTGQLLWVKQRPVWTAYRISATTDDRFIYLQGNTNGNALFFVKVSLCN